MFEFLSKNIVIPKDTYDYPDFNFAVYMEYIVEKDGSTSIHKTVDQYCQARDWEKEVWRVCNLTRYQKPGMQEGLPVRVKIRLPIRIQLE